MEKGFWYSYNDNPAGGTSKVWPEPGKEFLLSKPARKGWGFAPRMTGEVTNTYEFGFIGMGLYLSNDRVAFDLNVFTGLSFWYKGNMSFRVKAVSTHPDFINHDSDNQYGKDFTASGEWQKFEAPFSSFSQQPGWGTKVDIKKAISQVKEIQFVTLDRPHKEVDLWVDELEIY